MNVCFISFLPVNICRGFRRLDGLVVSRFGEGSSDATTSRILSMPLPSMGPLRVVRASPPRKEIGRIGKARRGRREMEK